jgi:hypothetical protein
MIFSHDVLLGHSWQNYSHRRFQGTCWLLSRCQVAIVSRVRRPVTSQAQSELKQISMEILVEEDNFE